MAAKGTGQEKTSAFGGNLSALMAKKGVTIGALAHETGISYNMIKKYCLQGAEPTISYAYRIASALQVSVEELLGVAIPRAENMFRETFERDFTYLGGFLRNVRRFSHRKAIFDTASGRGWTYGELNRDVNRLANALAADGVGKGDVVLYELFNSPEFVFSFLAPQKLGAVNCPFNYNTAPGEAALVLEDSRPKVFIYDSAILPAVTKALEMTSYRPPRIVVVDWDGKLETVPEGHIRFSDYVKDQPDTEPQADFTPNIYAENTRLYTSGTTGRPKGVPLFAINDVLSAHDVMMHYPMNSTDRTMNMTPWFHRGGLHTGLLPTLYAGAEAFILREFNPKSSLRLTEQYAITFLIGVPSVLNLLARTQERQGYDLSSLKGIITMGAPLERAACIHYQKTLTPNIFNGYGTTESFWNTFLRPYDLPEMSGTAGRACTDDEVRIIRAEENGHADPDEVVPCDNMAIGEIIIKSPWKSACRYHNNPAESERKFYKGYLYTGDLGTWDKDQFITVVGRKDDMIISAGENIYPTQIEEAINSHPKVRECVVIGVPDKLRGEAVAAYVIPEDDSLSIEALTAYCAKHPMLSPYKRPRYYRLVQELPLTATGKKMHYKMREIALDDLESGLLKRA